MTDALGDVAQDTFRRLERTARNEMGSLLPRERAKWMRRLCAHVAIAEAIRWSWEGRQRMTIHIPPHTCPPPTVRLIPFIDPRLGPMHR